MTEKLSATEFNSYYAPYISMVKKDDIIACLTESFTETLDFYNAIPDKTWSFSYAEDKWTIKEIVQHLLDTERVFAFRGLCISRKETTALPGFDQDMYVELSNANFRTKENLIEEYKAVRNASIALYKSFTNEMLMQIGTANNSPLSVRAAGYIIAGHEKHHCNVIKERYL